MTGKAMKYRLKGTRVRIATGGRETFETTIIASGYDDAQKLARYTWREVVFDYVAQVVD